MSGVRTDARLPYAKIEEDFLAPRDPILGYIKIGGKSSEIRWAGGSGKPWVAPTRYTDPARFEVTTREKVTKDVEGRGKAKGEHFSVDLGYKRDEAFHSEAINEEQPSALRIRLLYPTWGENLVSYLGAWGGSAWACRGNGVEAIDAQRGPCVCPCPRLKQFEGKYEGVAPNDGRRYKLDNVWKSDGLHVCKPHGQLNVMLEDAEIFGGFWAFKTTSYESISNLIKTLQTLQNMFGRLDGLPLELRVMAATKSFGGGITTQPIVTLVLAASMGTARRLAAAEAKESRKYLPAGGKLDAEQYREAVVSEMETEAESYAGEFLPADEKDEESAPLTEGWPVTEKDVEALKEDPFGPVRDDGPDFEIVPEGTVLEVEEARQDERPGREKAGNGRQGEEAGELNRQPGREPAEEPEDEPATPPDRSIEAVCREVLKAAGWDDGAIDGRIAYHVGVRSLETLADRLERGEPKAWAKVNAPGFLEDDEPKDGLAE